MAGAGLSSFFLYCSFYSNPLKPTGNRKCVELSHLRGICTWKKWYDNVFHIYPSIYLSCILNMWISWSEPCWAYISPHIWHTLAVYLCSSCQRRRRLNAPSSVAAYFLIKNKMLVLVFHSLRWIEWEREGEKTQHSFARETLTDMTCISVVCWKQLKVPSLLRCENLLLDKISFRRWLIYGATYPPPVHFFVGLPAIISFIKTCSLDIIMTKSTSTACTIKLWKYGKTKRKWVENA